MSNNDNHKKALEIEFCINVAYAERGNNRMKCDCCLESVPIEFFDKKNFIATGGTLLCDLCGSES